LFFVPCALALPLAACAGKSLDAGSNDAAAIDAGTAETSPTSTPGTGSAGSPCEDVGACAAGLECLGFAVHPEGKPCEIVGKMCTRSCAAGDESACVSLGPTYKCFGGCGDDFFCGATGETGATIEVTDAPATLTAGPGDSLFSIKLTAASKPFVPADLLIDAAVTGATGTVMVFVHNDTNRNGLLDVGESLDCSEPSVNVFDETTVGKTVNVGFSERVGGTNYSRAKGVWRP
jgi:hypothetical protein